MWELKACRGCLSMKAKMEKYNDQTKNIYTSITGLTITEWDGYPNYFCVECVSMMKKVLAFRRKMRRAFYVMKEIMLKKKQITYYEILTVDRRRTNLKSSIGYWSSPFMGFYTINVEPDENSTVEDQLPMDNSSANNMLLSGNNMILPGNNMLLPGNNMLLPGSSELPSSDVINVSVIEKSKDLERYNPTSDGHVMHVINIMPDKEYLQSVEDVPDDRTVEDDISNVETLNQTEDVIENIDLTNVFEDLVDEAVESDHSWPDELPRIEKKKKIEDTEEYNVRHPKTVRRVADMLAKCHIKVATKDEQIEMFELRKQLCHYASAIFKCSICLTVYKDIDMLKEHVIQHNNNAKYRHVCPICHIKYPTEDLLKIHHTENHKYIYKCMICKNRILHRLVDVIKHRKLHKNDRNYKIEYNLRGFRVLPMSHENTYLKLAHKDSVHQCTECHMRFCSSRLLTHHEKGHIEVPYYVQCDICRTWHPRRDLLTRHMVYWHLFRYECKQCPEVYFNSTEASQHFMTEHKKNNRMKCDYCRKVVITSKMKQHRNKRHYSLLYPHDCVACGLAFATLAKLYKHQFEAHDMILISDPSNGDEGTRCKVCQVHFMNENGYKRHAFTKRHDDTLVFDNACVKCWKLFDTEEEYKQHVDSHVTKAKYPRECSYCKKKFPSPVLFFKHQASKHDISIPEYVNTPKLCELCGERVFMMRKHMRRHEDDAYAMKCELCKPSRAFNTATRLTRHLLASHTPLPYVCAICEQGFSGRQECLDHILKLHAPERPFKCEICCRQFSHRDYLREHAKKMHYINLKRAALYPNYISNYILVYPHMKLNLSLVKPEVRGAAKIRLSNYTHTAFEKLQDVTDYIITDKIDEIADDWMPKNKKRTWHLDDEKPPKRRRVRKNKKDIIKEEIIQGDDGLYDNADFSGSRVIMGDNDSAMQENYGIKVKNEKSKKKKNVVKIVGDIHLNDNMLLNDNNIIMSDYANITGDNDGVKDNTCDVKDTEVVKEELEVGDEVVIEDVMDNSNEELVINEDLKIFEDGENQFVYINGVIYKVETS